jgi:hypothetical protein
MYRKKFVRSSEISRRPIVQHTSIPPDLQPRIKSIYDAVARYIYPSFERWEFEWLCEMDMDGEIAVWEQIAQAFQIYHEKAMLPIREFDAEQRLVSHLCSLSLGKRPKGLPPQEVAKLLDSMRAAGWTRPKLIILVENRRP